MNEIDYSDKGKWKKFVEDYIIPLRGSTDALVEYWNYLKEEIDCVPFNEIENKKDENFKTILLGGVKENGDYSERSLALFYHKFFGARLSNLQEYLISQREGVTSQVTGAVEESEFMKFVKNISEKTKAIVESASQNGLIDAIDLETSKIDFDEFIKEPEKVAELIKDFYNNALKITVNYNPYTLFLWTIRKITRRYLETAYPELREEEKFEALKSFVGLEKYFEPEIEEKTENDKKVKRDYTIWHLPENSFGGRVCGLNEVIWEYLGKEDFRKDLDFLFERVIDLRADFMERVKKAINDCKFPEYVRISDKHKMYVPRSGGSYDYLSTYIYTISGIILSSFRYSGYSTSGNYNHREEECSINLLQLFDDLSPLLFAGIINPADLSIQSNNLQIYR